MLKEDKELVTDLNSSRRMIGQLYPVLVDAQGRIIDGHHRLEADKNWPRFCLDKVKTEKDLIIARLISNACRRITKSHEKRELLNKLSAILLKENIPPGQISKKIAEEIGMSYTWVMKYLPDKYKDRCQSKRARSSLATKRVAGIKELTKLSKPCSDKRIKTYKYSNSEVCNLFC